jgi:hypothetical protein
MSLTYSIKLEPDDALPCSSEVTTFGEDEADAIEHARDAFGEAIAARMADKFQSRKASVASWSRCLANIAKSRALLTSYARECHPS